MTRSYQDQLKQGALVYFHKICVPSLDLLFGFGWLVLCLLLGIDMILAVLNDLC